MAVHTFDEVRAEVERQGRIIDEQEKAGSGEAKPGTEAEEREEGRGKREEETEKPETGTEEPETGTEEAETETEEADSGTEKQETGTKKRDWVEEAYTCFIKDAGDIDPTDPVKAIEAYFQKNATDELKARCKAEKKTAAMCWKFIEAVARKALHGSSGHIDPAVVYAIAMHWFEDVPGDWEGRGKREKGKGKSGGVKSGEGKREEKKAAKSKAKAKKPKREQGFFFEMLEAPKAGVGSGGVDELVSGGVGSGAEADATGTEQGKEVEG